MTEKRLKLLEAVAEAADMMLANAFPDDDDNLVFNPTAYLVPSEYVIKLSEALRALEDLETEA